MSITTKSNESIAQEEKLKVTPFAEVADLRDHFAGLAMQGIVRRYDGHPFGGGPNSPQYRELAEDAYFIADAMIAAKSR